MKKLNSIILILLAVAAPVGVMAQSGNILTQTRTWNSETGVDLVTTDTVSVQMEFTSFSADRIEYKSPGGSVQIFDITSTEGSWTDISQTGSIIYHVTIHNQNGIIILERTAAGVFLTVDMSAAAAGGIKMKYTISSIE